VLDIARMVRLSRDTMAYIRPNITVALGLRVVLLATAIVGVRRLCPAILATSTEVVWGSA
jgi:Cd2+/Zn2+-exporting ATPase